MTPQTADELEQKWLKARVAYKRRQILTAGFCLACMLILAVLLQHQQTRLSNTLDEMCRQRQINAQRAVVFYDGMIEIERRNEVQIQSISDERIALWEHAKPVVPTCEG